MIVSTNRNPGTQEFKTLVETVTSRLNNDAAKRSSYYLKRNAQLLEDDVFSFLDKTAMGTKFEKTIEKISGQRFPDIIAGKYYGIEVKSSKDDKWITLGGSVNESTRVDGVERIFLLFGKLIDPVEFKSRSYEDCLSDVVVTHYPRYKIDMNLNSGDTIFDKMNTTYDKLRLSENPVDEIVNYYKNQLSSGESLWWTGSVKKGDQDEAAPMKIRLWRTLSAEEKITLKVTGLALFPELTGSSASKFERFSLWLAAHHGVVSTSTRDSFSAGGQGEIQTSKEIYKNIPRVIMNIYDNKNSILEVILNAEESVLCETWNVKSIERNRVSQWINLVSSRCKLENNDIKLIMKAIFN